jgi:rhodanese-related sulfurtransferase
MTSATISPRQLAELVTAGRNIDLIDVRTPAEYDEVHLDNARNIPMDQLDPKVLVQQRGTSPSEPIYVICRTSSRSRQVCEKLLKAGLTAVVNVEGGTLACIDAGLPFTRGRKAVSLERQVRIAAGSLVLLGVGLGWLVHPAWLGLSAFIGAGLVFAGITDTCGMGLLLARAPWNRRGGNKTSSCAS